ncbi:MAG: hypothetical protein ACREIC_18840, partial [Limisphaerales bacterium]
MTVPSGEVIETEPCRAACDVFDAHPESSRAKETAAILSARRLNFGTKAFVQKETKITKAVLFSFECSCT